MTTRFWDEFPHGAFLAVVQVEDYGQAARNVRIARDNGADGAILINFEKLSEPLEDIYATISLEMPDYPLGLNFTERTTIDAIETVPMDASILWVDDSGIRPVASMGEASAEAQKYLDARDARGFKGLFFGGVKFQYNPHARKPPPAMPAIWAIGKMDAMVLSSWHTGRVPDPAKIRAVKRRILHASADAEHPALAIAVAGGVSRGNLGEYPEADCILAHRNICRMGTHDFDPALVRGLSEDFHKLHKTARRASA